MRIRVGPQSSRYSAGVVGKEFYLLGTVDADVIGKRADLRAASGIFYAGDHDAILAVLEVVIEQAFIKIAVEIDIQPPGG